MQGAARPGTSARGSISAAARCPLVCCGTVVWVTLPAGRFGRHQSCPPGQGEGTRKAGASPLDVRENYCVEGLKLALNVTRAGRPARSLAGAAKISSERGGNRRARIHVRLSEPLTRDAT